MFFFRGPPIASRPSSVDSRHWVTAESQRQDGVEKLRSVQLRRTHQPRPSHQRCHRLSFFLLHLGKPASFKRATRCTYRVCHLWLLRIVLLFCMPKAARLGVQRRAPSLVSEVSGIGSLLFVGLASVRVRGIRGQRLTDTSILCFCR